MIDLQKARKIAVLIFPDVEELDFVGVYEVLCKSRGMREEGVLTFDESLDIDIIGGHSPVTCRNGLWVLPHRVSLDFSSYDVLIVPGGNGIRHLMEDTHLLRSGGPA